MTRSDSPAAPLPPYLMPVIAQLRRRRIQVGIGDVQALQLALRTGFGLSSRDELRELCVALWAKSAAEVAIVRAAFAGLEGLADWTVVPPLDRAEPRPNVRVEGGEATEDAGTVEDEPLDGDRNEAETGAVRNIGSGLGPGLESLRARGDGRGLMLIPQYPLTAREVAQAWRHLRRPVRSGPAVELDVAATIRERARLAVAIPPILAPRRRNAVRLLMLIDRNGSMTPFHGYVDHLVGAIKDAGRIDDVQAAYFHDLPGSLDGKVALEAMADPFSPGLDDVPRANRTAARRARLRRSRTNGATVAGPDPR